MNLQILDRGPSEADARYVPAAVKMLTLVACMGYAVLDLEEALAEAGRRAVRAARGADAYAGRLPELRDARPGGRTHGLRLVPP